MTLNGPSVGEPWSAEFSSPDPPIASSLSPKKAFSSGFTLLELTIVMAIIAMLAVIAIPLVNTYLDRARIARARGDIEAIHKAIVLLEADTGLWPGRQKPSTVVQGGGNEIWNLSTGFAGLVANDGGWPSSWNGPYMPSIPLDPWGNPYFLDTDYQVAGRWRVVLGSLGPNGCCQNAYDSDDVIKILY